MKILVLIKEVPDMARVEFDRERGVVNRASAPAELNPFDLNALQAAVDLKAKIPGTVITAMTMGPLTAERTLRDAYARGADEGLLLSDRKFGGADTLATSLAIAAAVKKSGSFDLILCGEKSVDGDTAQIGPEVAEALDLPHACYVEQISAVSEKDITVVSGEICGKRQEKQMKLPAVVCVTKNINTPKLPTVDRKLKSLDVEITKLGFSDIEGIISEEQVGSKGSPTRVKKVVVQNSPERKCLIYKNDLTGFLKGFMERKEAAGIGK